MMEAAVRHLRDGAMPDGAACATCCVLDNLDVIGGALLLRHAVQSFISAMRQGRSQASIIRLVDLTGALADILAAGPPQPSIRPAQGSTQLTPPPGSDLELVDMFSDPWGWRQEAAPSPSSEQQQQQPPGPPRAPEAGAAPQPSPPPLQPSVPTTTTTTLDGLQAALLRPPPPPPSQGRPQNPAADAANSSSSGRDPGGGGGGTAESAAAAVGSRSVCVVIGCLSTLVERYGAWQALALLEAVQRSSLVSCMLTYMHKDLHPDQLVFALRRISSCTLDLSPLTKLQTEVAQRALAAGGASSGGGGTPAGGALVGRLDCRTRRRTGRVKVESELYSLLPPEATEASGAGSAAPLAVATAVVPTSRLTFHLVPPVLDAPDPKSLVWLQPPPPTAVAATPADGAAAAAPAPGGGGGRVHPPVGLLGGVSNAEELARAVGSSMRLTLTEEERRAKQQVVLPYQHQGRQHRSGSSLAAAYAVGDHAAYLPPAAGGTGPAAGGGGQQSLGHILYVRDSGSEADSDQELDEDLDI